MAKVAYDKQLTALLVIDPYNDFISEGGKIGSLEGFAEANKCVEESVWHRSMIGVLRRCARSLKTLLSLELRL
jgi:hypothetical protein